MEAVFAIVIAVLAGYWADLRFGTSPGGLITGAVVGFAAFVLRLLRMSELVERVSQRQESESPTEESESEGSSSGTETKDR